MGFGAGKQRLDRRIVEALEGEHARPRQERRIELEGRVLGGGADEHDRAVFHMRQEGVLLGAVEAVDLVDEEQRAAPFLAARFRRVEDFAQILHAGMNGRELLEMEVGDLGEEARHGGLAGARRAPEDHRGEPPGFDHARQHALLAEEMILADHLGERAGP